MLTAHQIKDLGKNLLRPMIPAHVRFQRSGRLAMSHGEPEIRELPRLVEPGTAAVDVGALVGDYSYALLRIVGPDGLVICVEPQASYARLLRKAAQRLRVPLRVVECALSSREGEAEMSIPVVGGVSEVGFASLEHKMPGGRVFRVPLRRLDDLVAGVSLRISFLKVDVEGHELEVFKGARETLRRHRPNLLVEIERRHSRVPIAETFAFLRDEGYDAWFLDREGRRRPISEFDFEKNAQTLPSGRTTEKAPPGYVSNFIFTPTPAPAG
jgi:FkbM family methyltransferase